MTRFRRKANHAHVYDLVRRSETHVTLRSAIESVLPIRTFEGDYEPAPDADFAPLFPSPAYGGVSADGGWIEWAGGEQPVSDDTEGLLRVEDGEVIYSTKLGTFNFSHDATGPYPGRRIVSYRVLSPVAVEEADAEAGVNLFLIRKRGAYYRPNEQGYTSSIAEAGRYSREDAERITHPNGSDGPRDGMDYVPAPSTPSPQIGKAGAGPVGEALAVPQKLIDDVLDMAAYLPGCSKDRIGHYQDAANRLAKWAREQNDAYPVEEPGEVERDSDEESYQIGKRDGYEEAVQHIDERTGGDGEYVAVLGGDPEDRNCPDAPSMVAKIVARFEGAVEEISRQTIARGEEGLRAETAEADLAETRERLEKLEAAVRPIVEASIRSVSDEVDIPDSASGAIWITMGEVRAIRATLSTQESSADLAGDA